MCWESNINRGRWWRQRPAWKSQQCLVCQGSTDNRRLVPGRELKRSCCQASADEHDIGRSLPHLFWISRNGWDLRQTVRSPSIAEIVGGEVSPQGWNAQELSWWLGGWVSDSLMLPSSSQNTPKAQSPPCHTWGRTKVLGGISVL